MSNYFEYKDKIAFHPGYYIQELVDESGLTQEDFAKRLGTTPKNLCVLIKGEQSLSNDIAIKLSRMYGTSIVYWLNIQLAYDELLAEFQSEKELLQERDIFRLMDYSYFREYFGLPDFPRQIDQQIKAVREFLHISSLTVLKNRDLAASFRCTMKNLSVSNVVNSNAMVQIAVNEVRKAKIPKFNRVGFTRAVDFALTLTDDLKKAYPVIKNSFEEAGVVLVLLPNLRNSGVNGATKRVDGKVLLLVNDRRHYEDTFWFTLFHEIGHIMNESYGVTFEKDENEAEDEADRYARNKLIPSDQYDQFVAETIVFDERAVTQFAQKIGRDPGIVYGRLQKDTIKPFQHTAAEEHLRHKYKASDLITLRE